MKLLIVGSRDVLDFDLTPYIPVDTEVIISGGAGGVDTVAEKYADEHKISKIILRPQYQRFGKAAPIIRNQAMVDMADMVIAIWNGKSRGTQSTIRYAKKQNKEITVVMFQPSEPF